MTRGKETFIFTWTIENYFFNKSEYLESPYFIADKSCGEWWFLIYVMEADFVYFYLNSRSDEKKVTLDIKIDLCNRKDEVFDSMEKNQVQLQGGSYSIKQLIATDELEKKMKDSLTDDLIIRCRISMGKSDTTECSSTINLEGKTEIFFDVFSFLSTVYFSNLNANWSVTKSLKNRDFCIKITAPEDNFLFEIKRVQEEFFFLEKVKCHILLLNEEVKEIFSWSGFFTFKKEMCKWNINPFLKVPSCKKITGMDYLYLKVTLSISNGFTLTEKTGKTVPMSYLPPTQKETKDMSAVHCLSNDMQSMLLNKEYADVSFRIESETLSAHKFILAARSPVFSAMFQQKMVESKTGVIEVTDMDVQTLKKFLEFMYTAEIQHMDWETALDLLLVGEKYQVSSLKEMCSEFLKVRLNSDNICEVASVADMVGHQLLKSDAIDFIKQNSTEVLGSLGWRKCAKKNIELCSEIIISLSEELKNVREKN